MIAPEDRHFRLSSRQLAVARGLLGGLSCKAIAIDLGVSHKTISAVKTVVFEKFGLMGKEQAEAV